MDALQEMGALDNTLFIYIVGDSFDTTRIGLVCTRDDSSERRIEV